MIIESDWSGDLKQSDIKQKYRPERFYREWRSKNAWDLSDEEIKETFNLKKELREYAYNKFFDNELKRTRKIDPNHFNPAFCNEAGGIWIERRSGGECLLPSVGFVSFGSRWDSDKRKSVSDLGRREVRVERRFDGVLSFDVELRDVSNVEFSRPHSCWFDLGEDKYVRCDLMKEPIVIEKKGDSLQIVSGRLNQDILEKERQITDELEKKINREEIFDVDEMFAKHFGTRLSI